MPPLVIAFDADTVPVILLGTASTIGLAFFAAIALFIFLAYGDAKRRSRTRPIALPLAVASEGITMERKSVAAPSRPSFVAGEDLRTGEYLMVSAQDGTIVRFRPELVA